MIKGQKLKSHSSYKGSSKMHLMKSDAFMKHFNYRSNQIGSHTRNPDRSSINTAKTI